VKHATSHRRWKRIALFVGVPLLVLPIVAIAVLLVSSHTAPNEEIPVEIRQIPSDWLAPTSPQSGPVSTPVRVVSSKPDEQRALTDKSMSGMLAIIGNGEQFGTESYELQVSSENGLRMTSHGTFSFKVLFAAIKAVFSQELSLDHALRPDRYTFDIDGPLGIGSRHVEGMVVGNVVHVTSGDKEDEMRIGTDNPLVLGTFSTYAFIPLLFRLLRDGEVAEFHVIPMIGGKKGEGNLEKNDQLIILRVERASDLLIETGSREILVDKYILTSSIGNSMLLARDDEFLALIASGKDGSLIAYRSDYFPEGIILP